MGKTIDFQKAARKEKQKQENSLWRTLLDCLSAITAMHPWTQVDAGAPFAYIPEDGEQLILFHCVQDAPDSMGILVFPSPKDYPTDSGEKTTAREDARAFIEMEQYSVFLTRREEVPDEMQKIYRRLALDCKDGLWPWVIHKRRGYLGRVPEGDDLAFLLDCLGNFHMELKALEAGSSKPDFANGEMLLRYYSPDDKLWMNMIAPFFLPQELRHPTIFREDSPKLQELRTLPAADTVRRVEFDFGWLEEPVQDKADDEPYFPAQVVLTDRQTGEVLCLYHCSPDDLMDCAFTSWSEVLHAHGLPETLYVCRNDSYDLFEDLAQKLGVKLKRVKHLPAAERVLRHLGAV